MSLEELIIYSNEVINNGTWLDYDTYKKLIDTIIPKLHTMNAVILLNIEKIIDSLIKFIESKSPEIHIKMAITLLKTIGYDAHAEILVDSYNMVETPNIDIAKILVDAYPSHIELTKDESFRLNYYNDPYDKMKKTGNYSILKKTSRQISGDDKCPICLKIVSKASYTLETACFHVFCADCIIKWLDVDKKCPMCRCMLNLSELRACV